MSKYITYERKLPASANVIWDVITNKDVTPLFLYGCEVIFEPLIGASIFWKGKIDGETYVEGEIIEYDLEKKLSYTTRDPLGQYGDSKENSLILSFELDQIDHDNCILRVSQGDYEKVNQGHSRYTEGLERAGWSKILDNIEKILQEE